MKNLLIFLTCCSLFACSPEEIKKEIETNFVMNAMTDGQWVVKNFVKGSATITTDFAPYKFQFKKDLTVDAILISNSMVEKSGTWTADANAMTITSAFANANATLTLLNGTWKITNNSLTYVEASQTVNGELRSMRLEKL